MLAYLSASLVEDSLDNPLGHRLHSNFLEPTAHTLGAALGASLCREAFLAAHCCIQGLLEGLELVAHWVRQNHWNSWGRWSCSFGGGWERSFLLDLLDENVGSLGDHGDVEWHGKLVATSSQIKLDPLDDPGTATPGVILAHLVAFLDVLQQILEPDIN